MLIFKRFRTQDVDPPIHMPPVYDDPVSPKNVRSVFAGCSDLFIRTIAAGGTNVAVEVFWLDGTVSTAGVAEQVLRPLSDPVRFGGVKTAADVLARLDAGAAYGGSMRVTTSLDDVATALSFGSCAAVFDGTAVLFEILTDQRRSVQEPTIEKSVKGSKDAFAESLRVNTALVRSRLRTPKLKLAQAVVGRKSHTAAAILWIDGAAAPDVAQEVQKRLDRLDVDGLVLPDVVDSALSDAPRSPFPQVIHTERPDRLAALLLDGHTALLVEGMPLAFVTPASLPEFLRTNEDGAQHFLAASFLRLLRWSALFLSLLLPALYLAMAMYHAEMLPTELLLSVIDSKQSVPFSTTTEILGMLLSFELIQEAGLRLPDPVGQTVSIIGALIVGQSAVEAKVISPIAVIVVALAGIAGYTMPSQDLGTALRLCRFALAAAGAFAGMFGVVLGLAVILWHLCTMESFGRAYLPAGRDGARPAVRRRPPWQDTTRDPALCGSDRRRRA